MKKLTQILTIALISVFSFGIAQAQETGDKEHMMKDEKMKKEQMMEKEAMMKEEAMMASGVQFSKSHARGHEQARVSPNAVAAQTIGTTQVLVTYGRPGIKGRTYFADGSKLAPTGKWWRTGANESAVITFSGDVMLAGQKVAAGTYSLYSVPGNGEWTIILNNKISWGTQYDKAKDYIRVKTTAINNDASMEEWFAISFDTLSSNKAHLNLHWGTTNVAVPITVAEK